MVFEALGRGLVIEPFLDALMVGSAIAQAGTPAQRESLDGLIAGARVAALACAEPDAGYELSRVSTRAERDGAGWRLHGTKAVVNAGGHADLYLVSARTSGAGDEEDGISLFLVEASAPGLSARGYALVDGGRAAELTLDQVRVPQAALLGQAGAGHALLEHATGRGLLALCAEALGAMDCARDATLEYLRTRRQFGAPIGSFQALQHRMADLLLEIEQARSAVINAAAALDLPDRLAREQAVGGQVHHWPDRHAGGRGEHPAARRHRHDLGAAAGSLRQAAGHDRPPAGRRGPPSAALHRAGPPTRPERIMTAGTAPPVTKTQEPPLAPPFAAPLPGARHRRRATAGGPAWPRR